MRMMWLRIHKVLSTCVWETGCVCHADLVLVKTEIDIMLVLYKGSLHVHYMSLLLYCSHYKIMGYSCDLRTVI